MTSTGKILTISFAMALFVPMSPASNLQSRPPINQRKQWHNADVRTMVNRPINARKRMQQQRIARGISNGSLKAGQTARLERKEAGLNREERGMKLENGGKLTPGDRKLIRQQQNQLSQNIYRQKHN